ncbi:hypothetical protein N7467_000500 [Penicillium canescens]|nr:hypothetical protein N7467_000500 [Penicillium canescens]
MSSLDKQLPINKISLADRQTTETVGGKRSLVHFFNTHLGPREIRIQPMGRRWFKEAAEQAATQQEIEKFLSVQRLENLLVFLDLGSVFEAYAPDLTVSKPIELATQTDMFDITRVGDLNGSVPCQLLSLHAGPVYAQL